MDAFCAPNYTQTIHNDPDLVDTCQPLQQDCPPSLQELTRLVMLLIVPASAPPSMPA